MEKDRLLPCPAGHQSGRVIGGPNTKGGPKYWAGCDVCNWRAWGDTQAEAIAAWNTRAALEAAQLSTLLERVRVLEDALKPFAWAARSAGTAWVNEIPLALDHKGLPPINLTLGDLRAANRAIEALVSLNVR